MAEEGKIEKRAKSIPVREVSVAGKAVLVEWLAGKVINRATVPVGQLVDGKVDETVLSAGVPYGVPWDEVKLYPLSGAELKASLNAAGIWTGEDLSRNVETALAVVRNLQNAQLGALLELVAKYQGG